MTQGHAPSGGSRGQGCGHVSPTPASTSLHSSNLLSQISTSFSRHLSLTASHPGNPGCSPLEHPALVTSAAKSHHRSRGLARTSGGPFHPQSPGAQHRACHQIRYREWRSCGVTARHSQAWRPRAMLCPQGCTGSAAVPYALHIPEHSVTQLHGPTCHRQTVIESGTHGTFGL